MQPNNFTKTGSRNGDQVLTTFGYLVSNYPVLSCESIKLIASADYGVDITDEEARDLER